MRKGAFVLWFFPLLLLAASPVVAATHKSQPHIVVNIALTVPTNSLTTGEPIPVSVVVTSSGVPVVKHLIRFYAAGAEVGGAKTNSSGYAATTIHAVLPAGIQTITAIFKGGGPIESARASRSVTVTAASLSIRVVPYIPKSIAVRVDGGPALAPDAEGYINTSLPVGGHLTLQAVLLTPPPNVRVTFVDWSNGDVSLTRTIKPHGRTYTQIALQVAYLTPLKFQDGLGRPLARSQVQGLSLTGPDGTKVAVGNQSAVWLTTPVPRRTSTGALAVGATTYALVAGYYKGVNVANQGVDRFVPSDGGTWTMRLAIFPLALIARNAFLGAQVGGTVAVTGPEGTTIHVVLPSRGQSTITVPSGLYAIKLVGGGFGPGLKVRVSRATSVPIPVITLLDIVGGAVAVAVAVLSLLALGPWRRRFVSWVFAGEVR
ncbi:MAG TPA: hypothetical protein VNF75_08700 [Candidatus Dormibacteraeota bacterium]|nr:hypothetical protein [Candidatus Dormibacteraeota bacterium]